MKNPIRPVWHWFPLLACAIQGTSSVSRSDCEGPIPITAYSPAAVGIIDRFDTAMVVEVAQLRTQGYDFSRLGDGLPTITYLPGTGFATLLPEGRLDFGGQGLTGLFGGIGHAFGNVDSSITGLSAKDANGNAYLVGFGDTPTNVSQAINAFGHFVAIPASGAGVYGWSGSLTNFSTSFPNGTDASGFTGISLNGSVMIGYSLADQSPDPFYWTLPGGYPYVPAVPPGVFSGRATAINALGTLGIIDYPDPFGGSAPSGSIGIINYGNASILPQNLGKFPGSIATHSYGLSGDGSTISGWYSDPLSALHPMIWKGNNFRDLGLGTQLGQAYASTSDGTTVVGGTSTHAFVWTAMGGMMTLPNLRGATSAMAVTISGDGAFIGGSANGPTLDSAGVAQIWTGDGITYNLQSLMSLAGQNTTNWTLNQVTAIVHNNDNSYFFGGYGRHNGSREGFVFELDFSALPPVPTIQFQPVSQSVPAGIGAVFSVVASSATSYQWLKNGVAISGATNPTLTLSAVKAADAGVYTVSVTNSGGSTLSANASLAVNSAGTGPTFTSQPVAQKVARGSTLVFNAPASAGSTPSYQWQLNGTNIAGATSSRLVLSDVAGTNVGTYVCVATAGGVSATSNPVTFAVTGTTNVGRLINLSVNTTAGKSQILTVGFVSGGTGTTGSESLLIRATGPALAALGVTGTLADPTLTVLNGQTVVVANDNWGTPSSNQSAVTAADVATFAFPLTNPAGLDAAVAQVFPAAAYTVQIGGNTAPSGTALAEVYDNTPTASYAATVPRLINLSAKNQIAANGTMTAGFVVGGTTSKTVLVRATGPALALLGVTGTIPDPQIALHTTVNGQDTVVATNAGWGGDPQITAASNSVFAFPLTNPASKDSVVLVTLAPGAYTAIASSVSGAAGVVLIEIYDVP